MRGTLGTTEKSERLVRNTEASFSNQTLRLLAEDENDSNEVVSGPRVCLWKRVVAAFSWVRRQ